jgi:uncharacterized protein (TIGR02145 family)
MKTVKIMSAITAAIFICNAQPITTGIKVKDMDGHVYHTVKIGNQVWTIENFMATKLNDGTPISYAKDSASWVNLSTPGYCYYKNKAPTRLDSKASVLYNWKTIESRKLAPQGWHIPSDSELTVLSTYLFGDEYSRNKFKAEGLIKRNYRWFKQSNFYGLPAGGCRYGNGAYRENGTISFWWSDSSCSGKEAFIRKIDCKNFLENRECMEKIGGCSVRLIMDKEEMKKYKFR